LSLRTTPQHKETIKGERYFWHRCWYKYWECHPWIWSYNTSSSYTFTSPSRRVGYPHRRCSYCRLRHL